MDRIFLSRLNVLPAVTVSLDEGNTTLYVVYTFRVVYFTHRVYVTVQRMDVFQ